MAAFRLPHIVFEATAECNLDCRYCYNVWKRPGATKPERAGFRGALSTLLALFRQARVSHVTFSGGEPFLSERFLELVLACRMRHKTVTVITNGCSASEADYRSLVDIGVGLFEIPVLSCLPGIHDRLTRRKGSWKKVLKSIQILQDLAASLVAVVVLTKVNLRYFGETLEFLKDRGIKQVMLNRFNVGGTGISEWEDLSPLAQDLRQAYAIAETKAAELELSISANVCVPHCLLDPEDFPHLTMLSCSPRIEERPTTLDAAGNLRLCNHSPTVLGNIHRNQVREIFQSPSLTRFAQTVPKPCVGCEKFSLCQGGCKAAGEQLWGSLEQGDPLLHLTRFSSPGS
jgi:radical SAM protein with 4Fe4S-binding SPASM domain